MILRVCTVVFILSISSLLLAQESPPGKSPVPPPGGPPKASAPAAKQPVQVLTPPIMAPMDSFTYDPTGKRDPFEPEIPRDTPVVGPDRPGELTPTIPDAIPTRPLEPLENFELSQLRVTAIIWDTRTPRAMIMDPNGASHFVKAKSRIGKKNGFVAVIREGEVVVVEYVQENGQYAKSFSIMSLR